MLRLRLLRLLLPLLLVVLAYLLWSSWQPPGARPRTPASVAPSPSPRAENLSFQVFEGSVPSVGGNARLVVPREDGSLHLEGIQDLEIQRAERGPLLVSAERGLQQGLPGARQWEFSGRVVFVEPEQELRLELPGLQIDEAAGEATSAGEIRFQAANLAGRAQALLYGLRGQPTELTAPALDGERGDRLTAERGRLLDGIRDIELLGSVRASRPDGELTAGRVRLLRGPEGRLRQAVAETQVLGRWRVAGTPAGRLRGERLELRWDGAGEPEFLALHGDALLARGPESLTAASIEALADGAAAGHWKVVASGGVYVEGSFGGSPGLLRADRVRASLDEGRLLREAEAEGGVRYEGPDLQAEAQRGSFVAGAMGGEVELFGEELRKARLAQGQTRVAGRTLRMDLRGERLEAVGLVEATLLPDPSRLEGEGERRTQLFVTGQAVHFVSDRLVSEGTGKLLTFTGAVRGWQGERSLAAASVVVDQLRHTLQASDAVATRIPRESLQHAPGEADYVQIAADRLDYDDAGGLAVYQGKVRVRLAEGWLEAERVEVELGNAERRMEEVRASEGVRIEFHRTSSGEMARALNGTADRLVYRPRESMLRLFGDRAPAVVRRAGEGGGTTTGRALNYDLSSGMLEVESGEQGAGRIKS